MVVCTADFGKLPSMISWFFTSIIDFSIRLSQRLIPIQRTVGCISDGYNRSSSKFHTQKDINPTIFQNRMIGWKLLGIIICFLGVQSLHSQTGPSLKLPTAADGPKEVSGWTWEDEIQSIRPNYYKAKQLFDQQFGGKVPVKGWGYKSFKRWEYRVISRLDDSGYVVWGDGALTEFLNTLRDTGIANNSSMGSGSSTGSGTGSGSGSGLGGTAASGSGGSAGAGPAGGRSTAGSTNSGPTGGNATQPSINCGREGHWEPVGPIQHPWNQSSQPTGIGRINGIAFHPTDTNTLFALAPQGGVWKTTDYGKTWSHFWKSSTSTSYLTLGASAMVLSYRNPDTLYIGTGDCDAGDAPGYGVIFSTNGGKTFALRNSGMGNQTVSRIIMHPRNSAILLASTSGGVFKSTNSGSTWTRTSPTSVKYHDLVFHPFNPNIVYATSNGLFYRSTDAGNSFVQITTGLPTSGVQRAQIAVSKADRSRVYMLVSANSRFQGCYLSTDSGQTFANRNTTPANILGYSEMGTDNVGQGWYDLDLAADPYNALTVYALGINVWKSTDGGATFKISGHWVGSGNADDIHADQHAAEFNTTGRTLFVGNDGGIYFSNDGGKKYNNISSGIQNSQIYRIAVSQNQQHMSATGYQDNGSAQHQNDQFFTYYGGDGMDCAVDPSDDNFVYGSYVYGSIYRSIDKTRVSTTAENGTNVNEGGGWLTPFVLQEGNPHRMFAGYVNVWRSDSVKNSATPKFTKISTGFTGNVRAIKNSAANNNILYVVRGDGKLYRSDNAGTAITPNWVDLSPYLPVGITLRAFEPSYKDSNVVYIMSNNTLYKSTNKGLNWTSIGSFGNGSPGTTNFGIPTALRADSSGKYEDLYIGTDRGVYVYLGSTAGTSNGIWDFMEDFPIWADVTDLEISYNKTNRKESYLYASTYGRGVWRSHLHNYSQLGSTTLTPDMYAFDSIFTVGATANIYQAIQGPWNGIKWKVTPYDGYSYINGDSVSNTAILTFSKPGIYSVSLSTTGCVSSKSITKINWIKVFPNPASATCKANSTDRTGNYGIGITRVRFADNTHESGTYFDDGNVPDFSKSKVFRVKPNSTYTAKIKAGLYNTENVAVYIDWNNNGKFENYKGEYYPSVSVAPGVEASFTIKPPSTLPPNKSVRMRVISDYNGLDSNACKTLNYGQGEDYSLVYDVIQPLFAVNKIKICSGEKVTYKDSSIGLIHRWDWDFGIGAIPRTATGAGPHTVTYTTAGIKSPKLKINGTDSITRTALVSVIQVPNAKIYTKSGALQSCQQLKLTLAARDSFATKFTTTWQKMQPNSNPNLTVDSLLTFNSLTLSDSGNYRIILDNNGCKDTSLEVRLVVYPKPIPTFTVNADKQCLRNNNFQFIQTSTVHAGNIPAYTWRIYSEKAQSPALHWQYSFSKFGSYSVVLKTKYQTGCEDSTKATVMVYDQPKAKFSVNDSIQCDKGNSFKFTNESSIGSTDLLYFTWTWGDGNSVTGSSPSAKTYSTWGTYPVKLVALSSNNCSDTARRFVRVAETAKPKFTVGNYSNTTRVFCENETVVIDNQSTTKDPGPWKYRLAFSNGLDTTAELGVNAWSVFPRFGNYTATLKSINTVSNCIDTATDKFTVLSIPSASFNLSPNPLCALQQVLNIQSTSTNADGNALQHAWIIADSSGFSKSAEQFVFAKPGNYTVKHWSTNGKCTDTASSQNVVVVPAVSAQSTVISANQRGELIQYTAMDTSIPGYQYRWIFGDGKSSATPSGFHLFRANNLFMGSLTVSNSLGCRDSTTFQYDLASANYISKSNSLNFYLFPNPSNGVLNYKFQVNSGDEVEVVLTTILGQQRLVYKKWKVLDDGPQFDAIDLNALHIAPGAYPFEIRRGNDVLKTTVIYLGY